MPDALAAHPLGPQEAGCHPGLEARPRAPGAPLGVAARRAPGRPDRGRLQPPRPGRLRPQPGRPVPARSQQRRRAGRGGGAHDRGHRQLGPGGARPLHADRLARVRGALAGADHQHPPLLPPRLRGRGPVPPGLRARRQGGRGHRALRHRRARRRPHHRAGRGPGLPPRLRRGPERSAATSSAASWLAPSAGTARTGSSCTATRRWCSVDGRAAPTPPRFARDLHPPPVQTVTPPGPCTSRPPVHIPLCPPPPLPSCSIGCWTRWPPSRACSRRRCARPSSAWTGAGGSVRPLGTARGRRRADPGAGRAAPSWRRPASTSRGCTAGCRPGWCSVWQARAPRSPPQASPSSFHPRNPYAPTAHANIRLVRRGDAAWFGGGADLTPHYLFEEDCRDFHRALRDVCERHAPGSYARHKRTADEYFLLRHRGERRGVGGIFFEDLGGDLEAELRFAVEVARAFLAAYLVVLAPAQGPAPRRGGAALAGAPARPLRGVQPPPRPRHRVRARVRWPDRVDPGLAPPRARWAYDHRPAPDSREAELLEVLRTPRDWV